MSLKKYIDKLKKRNVIKAALSYLAVVWMILEACSILFPIFEIDKSFQRIILIFFVIAFPVWLVFAWIYEYTDSGFKKTEEVDLEESITSETGKKMNAIIISGMAIAIVLLLVDRFFNLTGSMLEGINAKSIMVLPFDNKSGEDDAYFVEGITEDILTQISKVKDLKVLSRYTMNNFDSKGKSPREIGEELNVRYLLTGSVRRIGNDLRIGCQLINTVDETETWAESFDRQMINVFDIQSEIALEVANLLKIELSIEEIERIEQKPTNNLDAYNYYLKGREEYYRYDALSNEKAINLFKQALELDPKFSLAWSALGDAYGQKNRLYGMSLVWNDSSIISSTQAIKLDPTSSEGYKSLASAYNYNGKYDQAFEFLKKSVDLNPNNAQAVGNLGSVYFTKGQLYNSMVLQMKSADLNPKSFIPPLMIGWTYRLLGNLDKAEEWLLKSLQIKPYRDTYRELGFTYILKGNSKKAIALIPKFLDNNTRSYEEAGLISLFANDLEKAHIYFEKAVNFNHELKSDPNSISSLVLSYIMLNTDYHNKAVSELNRLEILYLDLINSGSQNDDYRVNMAGIKIMQGNHNEAILWLKRALDVQFLEKDWLEYTPWFEPLRTDKEYKEIITDLENRLSEMAKRVDSIDQ